MRNAALAGAAYFAIVFAAGFALGTLRVLLIAPALGAVAATALELPVILGASWIAAAFITRRLEIGATAAPRLVMGAIAFALLIATEMALASIAFGRSISMQIAAWKEPAGALGLAGQLAFAAIPFIQAQSR